MLSSIACFLFLIAPILAWRFRGKLGAQRVGALRAFGAGVVACSFLYVIGVQLIGWELKRQWDPDGNGELDDPTPAMRVAMKNWSSDTGRMYAPIVALPASVVWMGLNFIAIAGFAKISNKLTRKDWTGI